MARAGRARLSVASKIGVRMILREVAGRLSIGGGKGGSHEGLVVGENLVELCGALAVLDGFALDDGDGGFERFGGDQLGETRRALGQEPREQFGVRVAFGDRAAEVLAEGFEVAFVEEEAGGLGDHLAVAFGEDIDQQGVAGGASEGCAGLKGVADAGGRERCDQGGEMRRRVGKETGQRKRSLGQRGLAAFDDFIPDAEKMDGVGGQAPLVVGSSLFQQAEHAGEFLRCAIELGEAAQQRLGAGGLFLGLARLLERIDDVEMRSFGTLAHEDEFVLSTDDKAPIGLELGAQDVHTA